MKTYKRLLILGLFFALAASPLRAQMADNGMSPSLNNIYAQLAPYGSWNYNSTFGWTWRPSRNLDPAQYPWGLDALQFGNWGRQPYRGWVWFPDARFPGMERPFGVPFGIMPGGNNTVPNNNPSLQTPAPSFSAPVVPSFRQ